MQNRRKLQNSDVQCAVELWRYDPQKLTDGECVALSRIDDKKYAQKYILPAKEKGVTVHKLGINFGYAEGERNITEFL